MLICGRLKMEKINFLLYQSLSLTDDYYLRAVVLYNINK